MQSLNRPLLLLLALLLLLLTQTACTGTRRSQLFLDPEYEEYFKAQKTRNYSIIRLKEDSVGDVTPYEYRIQPGDQIQVSFYNIPFELITGRLNAGGGGGILQQGFPIRQQYLVDVQGYMTLLVIGRIKVEGKTLQALRQELTEAYSEYYDNPVIDVNVASLRVFVFTSAGGQGVIPLQREETHLVEVLAQVGEIAYNSKINKLKIIRGELDDPQIIWVNLRNMRSLGHPELVLHDQDIIYLEVRNLAYFLRELQPYTSLVAAVNVIPTIFLLTRNLGF